MNTEINNASYDDKVWQLLDANRSNWYGYDEKEQTVWPCNRKEIRKTKKVLKSIDHEQLTNQSVIDEYNAQMELVAAMKKELPNNRIKMIVPLAILLSVICFFFWYAHPPKSSNFDSQDWVVDLSTEFVSSSARKPNVELKRKTITRGTIVTPLAMGEQKRVKVKLPSGEIGYMHVAAFSGVRRNSEIVKGTQLFSANDRGKEIGTIENDMPKIISIPNIDSENNHYLKVRTSSGRIGYIYDNHIKYHFSDSIPEINSDHVLPVASTKLKKWKGQTITELENQYGPASAYMGDRCYWDYMRVIGDTLAYSGVIAYVNQEGTIDSIQFGKQEKLFASISFFPIWRMISSLEPFYGKTDMYYEQSDRDLNMAWWENLRSSHWSVRFITWIIQIILKIIWFLIKISIFFLPIMAIGVIISHLEKPSYRTSLRIVIWLLIFVYSYIAIFLLLQNSFSFIVMIILFGAVIMNFIGFSIHLSRKCYNCGNWDGEITERTDFKGQSVSVQYGSRDKYIGSDTKLTGVTDSINTNTKTYQYTTTNRYQRVRTKDTYQYDNYEDHKMCKYCGSRWKVSYKVLRGEKHQEY